MARLVVLLMDRSMSLSMVWAAGIRDRMPIIIRIMWKLRSTATLILIRGQQAQVLLRDVVATILLIRILVTLPMLCTLRRGRMRSPRRRWTSVALCLCLSSHNPAGRRPTIDSRAVPAAAMLPWIHLRMMEATTWEMPSVTRRSCPTNLCRKLP